MNLIKIEYVQYLHILLMTVRHTRFSITTLMSSLLFDIGQIPERQPDSVNGRQQDLKNISYKVIVSIKNDSENCRRPSNLLAIARISKIFHCKRLDDSLILSPATVRALHYLVNLTREIFEMMEMRISRIRSSIMRQKRLL